MKLELFLSCLLLAFSAGAVMARRLSVAALSLACASIALSLVLFALHAPWAAVMEFVSGTGFAAVFFAVACNLQTRDAEPVVEDDMRFYALPFLLAVLGLAFWLFSDPLTRALVPAQPPTPCSAGTAFWLLRWGDSLGQLLMLLAVVFAVKTFTGRKAR